MSSHLFSRSTACLGLIILPLLCASLSSCATDDDETIPVTKTGELMRPRLVGRVATVPSDNRFILIQSYGSWKVPTGTVLISHGADGRTANLLATGEAMGQYAAADIQSGEVQPGDAVFARDLTKPTTSDETTEPPPPAPTPATSEVPVP